MLTAPEILRLLVEAGVKVAELDDNGRNGLFNCVRKLGHPSISRDFEAVRYLLTLFDDIFACDNIGIDIFEMVQDRSCHNVWGIGSYSQDLWYCTLYRSGLARRYGISPPPTPLVFDSRYTIAHYCALLYLNTWDFSNWTREMISRPMHNGAFTCQEEREAAPAYSEWDPLDLLMMEERLRWAVHRCDYDYHCHDICSAIDIPSHDLSEEDAAD